MGTLVPTEIRELCVYKTAYLAQSALSVRFDLASFEWPTLPNSCQPHHSFPSHQEVVPELDTERQGFSSLRVKSASQVLYQLSVVAVSVLTSHFDVLILLHLHSCVLIASGSSRIAKLNYLCVSDSCEHRPR
jgi:hypothetical protein